MNCSPSRCDDAASAADGGVVASIAAALETSGAVAWGIAEARPAPEAALRHRRWVEQGRHGSMAYLARYDEVRRDPRLLLEGPGARSLIVAAFPYCGAPLRRPVGTLRMARYALGDDYHEVVRRRLTEVARRALDPAGGEWRVCIDTAPLLERYWAVEAGLGFVGVNGQLIVPGKGSYLFLGTIVTSLALPPSEPCRRRCSGCQRCVRVCPGGAISPDGSFDARRCLSYLTIENRGEMPSDANLGSRLYGCDACQEICPHNSTPPDPLPEFEPRPELLGLTLQRVLAMEQPEFSILFTHSAVKRAKLAGLRRNALAIAGRQEKQKSHDL